MYLSTVLPAILAIATPALAAALSPRAAKCSLGTTTTTAVNFPVATTLSGPFLLKTKTTTTQYNGRYGALTVHPIPQGATGKEHGLVISFDQEPESAAQEFYLMGNELIYVANNTFTAAYEPMTITRKTAYVLVGPAPEAGVTNLACSLDKTTCELACTANTFSYTCLADPRDQPDWRIVQDRRSAGPGCVPFTPIVVPLA